MKYVFALLLLFVAAGPMYEVHVQLSPKIAITDVNEVYGDHVFGAGSWSMHALDASGQLIAQTLFDPYHIGLDFEPVLVEDIWVSIPAPIAVSSLALQNDEGQIVATWSKPKTCGDGICSPSEGISCIADCPLQQEILAAEEELQTPGKLGLERWKVWVIAACVMLMAVLVLILIHINRKKENPVQMEYERL